MDQFMVDNEKYFSDVLLIDTMIEQKIDVVMDKQMERLGFISIYL